MSISTELQSLHRAGIFLFSQHLPANGQHRHWRPGVPGESAVGERTGVRAHLRVLPENILHHQWPQHDRVAHRHHSGQAHGSAGVHRLCMLGADRILRTDSGRRVPTH